MVSFYLGCMLMWGVAPPDVSDTPLVNCGKSYETIEACNKDKDAVMAYKLGDNAFVIASCGRPNLDEEDK